MKKLIAEVTLKGRRVHALTDKGREWLESLNVNPGIRKTVAWLNTHGFETVDSGDGKTHDHACDRGQPYVIIKTMPASLRNDALRLYCMLRDGEHLNVTLVMGPIGGEGPCIQASFDPHDGTAFLELMNVTDDLLFFPEGKDKS
jgi:hypothetical protein